MAMYVKVAKTSDLAPGEGKLVEAAGKRLALFNVEGAFHAIDDKCTHRGGPLSEGELAGTRVTCPWHGAVFDVTTGEVRGSPAPQSVTRYPVRVQDDDVEREN